MAKSGFQRIDEDYSQIEITKVKPVEFEGKKFNTYKTYTENGKLIDVKFVQGCQNIPTEPCYIVVETEDYNVDMNRKYPCVWVKNVKSIVPYPKKAGQPF